MSNVFWGGAIIAVGLFMGSSVFYGDFDIINIFFDGLGLFLIGKGVYGRVVQPSAA